MKQYRWRTLKHLKRDSKIVYINDCGEFCDVILEVIKPGIAEEMNIELQAIVTGQEDWGWYLEFQKDDIFYELDISYQKRDAKDAHQFGVTFDAWKKEKGFIFERKLPAETELQKFTKAVSSTATQNEIEIFEE